MEDILFSKSKWLASQKKEYILLLDLNYYKIPIQTDGQGFDRVIVEICPPGGTTANAASYQGGANQRFLDDRL